MSDVDEEKLGAWLARALPSFQGPVTLSKFPSGQSNPTYKVDAPGARYVLRRKPFGKLLPSAHAIEREYRLLTALHPAGFPVPKPLALCEDPAVIGSAFYLMELVEGRVFWNGVLPGIPQPDRRNVYEAMIGTLAHLHNLDHAQLGLEDFGRPGNYFLRQVDRWTRQYRSAQTDDLPDIERLIDWLPRTVPEQERVSIIHGDYRIDNLIFHPDAPRVAAVLDWELATIGDPLADFSYLAMNWVMAADSHAGLAGIDLAAHGLPALDDATALYCRATGRDGLPELSWYFAYNLFRLVCILQGIKKRMLDGNASSSEAAEAVARIEPLTKLAWEQARRAGAPVNGS